MSRLPSKSTIESNVQASLKEDVGSGDITAQLIPEKQTSEAKVIAREPAILCGQAWVNEVFRQLDPEIEVSWQVEDGDSLTENQLLFQLRGYSRGILTGERTALNFLQTLSGTATICHRYAALVAHTPAILLDTRKTIPGLREAQKYAVQTGGCQNHRMGLYDAFLIKENHINACGSITAAIQKAGELFPDHLIEIEVENETEFEEAVKANPDVIMLDNFTLETMRQAVKRIKNRPDINHSIKLEASGGIEQDSDLVAIAETGVDYISIGALTKHCRAIDLSMRFT